MVRVERRKKLQVDHQSYEAIIIWWGYVWRIFCNVAIMNK